ncbi:class I adenylate-forming enzyme family protein [Dactylosporangium sp. NPDC048998]|uniref:class I adenylate-forming enzyme family protein n=1 Tax=Dactylosporangium sp. NPDC048998 TaxID=3363976 RepID=UPI003718C4FC
MALVSRLLAARAQERPEEPAFIAAADGHAMSWAALAAYADRLRELAGVRRLPPGARIGLVVADPLAFAAVYLGALAAGLTVVPVDPRLPAPALESLLARLRVDVVITDAPLASPVAGVETWVAERAAPVPVGVASTGVRPSAGAASRPAVLLASSGTTGEPKSVPLSEAQLLHAARRVAGHHRFGPGQRGYSPLPLFHVNAQVMGLLAALVSGASLVLDRRFEPDAYWSRVAQWSPTWLNTVPAMLHALTAQPAPPEAPVARLRFARSASAPLPASTQDAFTAHTGIAVLNTYGMTEAAGQITADPLDVSARRAGSVGLPVGVGLAVAGPDGRPVPPGSQGMIVLRGWQVASRYLEPAGHGAEASRPARDARGWLPTGDLGFRDEDGYVYLVGRADDVINRGGEKVHPQEVENVLLGHPAVSSAAVVAAPHERLGQVPVAFVTLRPHRTEAGLVEELDRLCAQRLPRRKWPVTVTVTAELPTSPTGKVLRRALRADLTVLAGGPAPGGSR